MYPDDSPSHKKRKIHTSCTLPFFVGCAGNRGRTGTGITTHGILSPGRLPIPPCRHRFKEGPAPTAWEDPLNAAYAARILLAQRRKIKTCQRQGLLRAEHEGAISVRGTAEGGGFLASELCEDALRVAQTSASEATLKEYRDSGIRAIGLRRGPRRKPWEDSLV